RDAEMVAGGVDRQDRVRLRVDMALAEADVVARVALQHDGVRRGWRNIDGIGRDRIAVVERVWISGGGHPRTVDDRTAGRGRYGARHDELQARADRKHGDRHESR